MTLIGWVLLAILTVAVVWLVLAMIGLLREMADVRAELARFTGGPIELAGGLPVGSRGPAWTIRTPGGDVSSSAYAGVRHVLVFADTDCRTCGELMPALVEAAGRRALPPVVAVGRDGDDAPTEWSGDGVVIGSEHERDVSDAYGVDVSPHVFVLDEQGAIVAQGGAATLADVESLVRDAQGIRIVPGASHG